MSINLSLAYGTPIGVVATRISYARIDNLNGANPTFLTVVPDFTSSPANIAQNIPAGQYQINVLGIYPDGRVCAPESVVTDPCVGLTSISAYISSNNLIVQYLAPSDAPKVRVTVGYPNGGSFVANYVNTGTPIVIALPSGLFGNYTINGQSVCDESSGFYSALSATVNLSVQQPVGGTFIIGTSSASVCNGTPQTLYTAGAFGPGSILYTDSTLQTPVTGYTVVAYNNAQYSLGTTSGIVGNATGNTCSAQITGNTTMTYGMPNGSGTITAPAGTAVYGKIIASGPSGGTHTLQVFIPLVGIADNVNDGTRTFFFTMPPSGSVAWTGTYTSTDNQGSGSIILT